MIERVLLYYPALCEHGVRWENMRAFIDHGRLNGMMYNAR